MEKWSKISKTFSQLKKFYQKYKNELKPKRNLNVSLDVTTMWDNNEMSMMIKQCSEVLDLNSLNLNMT